MITPQAISKHLRHLRHKAELSRREVSHQTGLHQNVVAFVETHDPRRFNFLTKQLPALCDVYGITVTQFFQQIEYKTNTPKLKRVHDMYHSVPMDVRENLSLSLLWATQHLMNFEGSGHSFVMTPTDDKMIKCSFDRPGQEAHDGPGMPYGSHAIIMAVCEYVIEKEMSDDS